MSHHTRKSHTHTAHSTRAHRTMLPADQPDMTTTCQTDYFIVRPMLIHAHSRTPHSTGTCCTAVGREGDRVLDRTKHRSFSLESTRTRRTRAPHAHARLGPAVGGQRTTIQ
jgi:hypothetical protein